MGGAFGCQLGGATTPLTRQE
eukprot:COSAG01_NODE_46290_length_401_cov_1.043046_1_plen_20_part_10